MDNMPLRIISPSFQLVGEIDDYESLQFIRRFYKVGEFELHININKNDVDKLQEDNLILLGTSFNKVGIIMYVETEDDDNGATTLIVKGPTLKGILSRRLIVPPTNGDGYDSQTGAIETILKQFVDHNVVNPADALRKIPQVSIASDKQRGKQDKWRARFDNLADKVSEITEYAEIGWDVVLDIENNHWVFDIIEGKNLTVDQDTLPPVIFGTDFDNIKNPHFIHSSLNSSNVGYAGGSGDEASRLIQQIGDVSGFERIESFLDCSQAADVDELKSLGQQKLNEVKKVNTFEFSIIPSSTFVYEQDYDLGDTVTAVDRKIGLTMNCQIVELKEIYETDGFNLEATFGTNIPNLLTMFKKATKKIVR